MIYELLVPGGKYSYYSIVLTDEWDSGYWHLVVCCPEDNGWIATYASGTDNVRTFFCVRCLHERKRVRVNYVRSRRPIDVYVRVDDPVSVLEEWMDYWLDGTVKPCQVEVQ